MREVEKDGIVFVEDSDVVSIIQFLYEHLEKSVIFEDVDFDESTVKIIAYASSKEFNDKLKELYKTKYQEKGYVHVKGVSRDMVDSID